MNAEQIEKIIGEIRTELSTFNIHEKNLTNFDLDKPLDKAFLSYVNGVGGSYVKFLALLTKKLQFKNIVELGNREAISTLAIYDQLPENSKLTTIDILEDARYCPKEMFTDPRVKFITGDVCDISVLKQLPADIDFLFSDTIHFDFQIRDEFAIYQHLLADTALVAIDDIHTNDKGIFWDEVTYEKWDLSELCHYNGWGLFLFERKVLVSKEERWLKAVTAATEIWQRKYNELNKEKTQRIENSVKNKVKKIVKRNPFFYSLLVKIHNVIIPN